MKRVLCITFVIGLLSLCALWMFPNSKVNRNDTVELVLIYGEQNIQVVLPDDEAKKVTGILDGNYYDPFPGVPACGFTEDYALKVGSNFYAIAIDSCSSIMDCTAQRYFDVSQVEIDYIHGLFEKYNR